MFQILTMTEKLDLLQINAHETLIYMKTDCLQTKWIKSLFGVGLGKIEHYYYFNYWFYAWVERSALSSIKIGIIYQM